MPRGHHGHKQRRGDDGGKRAEKHIGSQKHDASAQHAGNRGRGRRRGNEHDQSHGLSDDGIPRPEKHVGTQTARHLQREQNDVQPVNAHRLHGYAAKSEQQHGHEQQRRNGGKPGKKGVSQRADDNGYKQSPLLEKNKNTLHGNSLKQTFRRPMRRSAPPSSDVRF